METPSLYEALYTTRAMRRVKSDPIPEEVQLRILDAAIRAPSGGNAQNWRFLLVDSPDVRGELGPIYRECMDSLWTTIYADRVAGAAADPAAAESIEFEKIKKSASYMARNFEKYPVLLFAFAQGDPTGGSIFPAVWSAMLAARAEGVGSTITTVFLFQLERVLDVLGVPKDKGWQFSCCVPMGYPTGRWGLAKRRPAHEVVYRNAWGNPPDFEIPEPLWREGD